MTRRWIRDFSGGVGHPGASPAGDDPVGHRPRTGRGRVSRYETVVNPVAADAARYVERLVKFLLWRAAAGAFTSAAA